MLVPYWIQYPDLTAEDHDPVDLAGAIALVQSHDWPGELASQAVLESTGRENCPPGIGFVPGDGRILHICPESDGKFLFHYHFTEPRKLLGLIPSSSPKVRTCMGAPAHLIPQVITSFFQQDHAWLISRTAAA